jgi:hypothetical protein
MTDSLPVVFINFDKLVTAVVRRVEHRSLLQFTQNCKIQVVLKVNQDRTAIDPYDCLGSIRQGCEKKWVLVNSSTIVGVS